MIIVHIFEVHYDLKEKKGRSGAPQADSTSALSPPLPLCVI